MTKQQKEWERTYNAIKFLQSNRGSFSVEYDNECSTYNYFDAGGYLGSGKTITDAIEDMIERERQEKEPEVQVIDGYTWYDDHK